MGGAYGTYGRQEKCIQSFVGRPEGNKSFGRPGRIWQIYIKVYLSEKLDGGHRLGSSSLEKRQMTCCCEYGNELKDFIK
jgi:hypothetical protein